MGRGPAHGASGKLGKAPPWRGMNGVVVLFCRSRGSASVRARDGHTFGAACLAAWKWPADCCFLGAAGDIYINRAAHCRFLLPVMTCLAAPAASSRIVSSSKWVFVYQPYSPYSTQPPFFFASFWRNSGWTWRLLIIDGGVMK